MKYIVFRKKYGKDLVREFPVIFPDAFIHLDVAQALSMMPDYRLMTAVAAGSIASMGIESECAGRSETLNLNSRGKQDTDLIRLFDYQHGIIHA